MTKQEFDKYFNDMVTDHFIIEETFIDQLKSKKEKVLNSGCLDLNDYPSETMYALPKTVLYAILLDLAAEYKPLDSQHRKEAENIKIFL